MIFRMWDRLCVAALVATTAWRVIFERTKKMSRIGPETPAVSDNVVQMIPHALEWPRRSTLRCSFSGSASVTNGVKPITTSATGLPTTSFTTAKKTVIATAPFPTSNNSKIAGCRRRSA